MRGLRAAPPAREEVAVNEPRKGDFWQMKAEYRTPWEVPAKDGGAQKWEVLEVKAGWVLYRAPNGRVGTSHVDSFVSIRDFHHNIDQVTYVDLSGEEWKEKPRKWWRFWA
jgi:hypothetical protein